MAVSAIFAASGKEYIITDEDALWLARMVVGEGGKDASVEKIRALLWAIMNRFLLVPEQRKRTSLTDLVRAFSQPINPRWDGEGSDDFCAPGGKYYETDFCSSAKLKRRAQITAMPWAEIPKRIKDEIEALRSGELPLPKAMTKLFAMGKPHRITNWASYPSVREKFPQGIDVLGDWFFEDKGALAIDVAINGVVARLAPLGWKALSPLLSILAGGTLAGLGYLLARRLL